jgi:uncharacterized peroxidase-related enzyme
VAALREDWRRADLDDRDRAMLGYVESLVTNAPSLRENDLARLREVGFDDAAILQITLIAAWFSYANQVADGLGVGRSGDAPGSRAV